jgi:hypothetical protein
VHSCELSFALDLPPLMATGRMEGAREEANIGTPYRPTSQSEYPGGAERGRGAADVQVAEQTVRRSGRRANQLAIIARKTAEV